MTKLKLFAACAALLLVVGCESDVRQDEGTLTVEQIVLTEANFEDQVLRSDKPVLVDFFATWCGPCRDMEPIVREVAADFHGRAIVGKVDYDRNTALVQKYGIQSLPTFLLFKDGQVVGRVVGPESKARLANMIEAQVDQ